MRYRLLTSLLLASAITACGDDGGAKPDAFVVVVDAPPDTPPPPPGCEYGELRDDTNDDAETTGSPEDTMVTFSGSAVLCGKLNSARFATGKVDADAYSFTISGDTELYVSMYGAGLDALGEVDLQIYGGANFGNLIASDVLVGNHAAVSVGLAAGTYEVYVRAFNTAAPATDTAYKVKLVTDMIDTRCPNQTTGGFTEAGDGANNLGNDMIGIDFDTMDPAMFQVLTTSTADTAEATALTITDTTKTRFTGNALATNAVVGSYKDRDTFEITTGPNTNELTIRTGWAATTADLDLFVFEKPGATATSVFELADSAFGGMGPNEEIVTVAVKPNTPYWVWIGNYKDSTGPGAYTTSICGTNYTPPAN